MIRGFYDQLGVASDAPPEAIRAAYHRIVVELRRRQDVVTERGGDVDRLRLARHQADEAWAILSDPIRRRRYDALLVLGSDGLPSTEEELWSRVSGALVAPEVSAAVDLLRGATELRIEAIPPAPTPKKGGRSETTAVPEPLGTVVALPRPVGVATTLPGPGSSPRSSGSTSATTASTAGSSSHTSGSTSPPNLRVVEGSGNSAPVIVMPRPGSSTTAGTPRGAGGRPAPPADTPSALLARFGPTGELLRRLREKKGLSLEDVSEQTRIAVRFLEALEQEGFDRLPSATFVRGYVRQVASLLGLDEDELVDGYMERFHEGR